jgi:hypothetical protein
MQEENGQSVMPVGINVRFDHDLFADNSFDEALLEIIFP